MRFTIFILLIVIFCPAALAARESQVTLVDDLKRSLTLSMPVKRVVVMGDFAAELLTALDAVDLVVGRSAWINWPPAVAGLPHLGLQGQPNLEVLLAWQPDLVLADAFSRNSLPIMEKLKLPVLVYQGRTLAQIRHAISDMGLILGRRAQAEKLLAFTDEIKAVLDKVASLPPGRAILAYSQTGPPYYDMLAVRPLLAMANLKSQMPARGGVGPEWMAQANPEQAILVLWNPPESLRQTYANLRLRPELAGIKNLYLMDSRLAYNLQALVGVLYLAKWCHGREMPGLEPGLYLERLWQEFFKLPLAASYVYP